MAAKEGTPESARHSKNEGTTTLPSDVRFEIGLRTFTIQFLIDHRTRPNRHGKRAEDATVAVLVDVPNLWHCATKELSYFGPEDIERAAESYGRVVAKLAFGPRPDGDPLAFGYSVSDFGGWETYVRPKSQRGEKDIDTLLVANMVELAHNAQIDTFVLVSGDADMLPGVVAAQMNGKDVALIGWRGSCSWDLSEAADDLTLVGEGRDREPSDAQIVEYDRLIREIRQSGGSGPAGQGIVFIRLGKRVYRDELKPGMNEGTGSKPSSVP